MSIDVYSCGAIMGTCARKRGTFEAFRSVSDAYNLWGRPCAKEGRLHRCTVEPHCGITVIGKVTVLR